MDVHGLFWCEIMVAWRSVGGEVAEMWMGSVCVCVCVESSRFADT